MNSSYLKNLTSEDEDILEQCLAYLNRLREQEVGRARDAEARATSTLTAIAIIAGLLTILPNVLSPGASVDLLLGAWLGGSVLFLAKSAFAILRSLGSVSALQLTHDLVEDFQPLTRIAALRLEASWLRWEIEQRIQVANTRLFWVSRGQRSLVASSACLLVSAGLLLSRGVVEISSGEMLGIFSAIVIGICLIFLDGSVERKGIWVSGSDRCRRGEAGAAEVSPEEDEDGRSA